MKHFEIVIFFSLFSVYVSHQINQKNYFFVFSWKRRNKNYIYDFWISKNQQIWTILL